MQICHFKGYFCENEEKKEYIGNRLKLKDNIFVKFKCINYKIAARVYVYPLRMA